MCYCPNWPLCFWPVSTLIYPGLLPHRSFSLKPICSHHSPTKDFHWLPIKSNLVCKDHFVIDPNSLPSHIFLYFHQKLHRPLPCKYCSPTWTNDPHPSYPTPPGGINCLLLYSFIFAQVHCLHVHAFSSFNWEHVEDRAVTFTSVSLNPSIKLASYACSINICWINEWWKENPNGEWMEKLVKGRRHPLTYKPQIQIANVYAVLGGIHKCIAFSSFIEVYLTNRNCVHLRYTSWYFEICTLCEMISITKIIEIPITLLIIICMSLWWELLRSTPLANFKCMIHYY